MINIVCACVEVWTLHSWPILIIHNSETIAILTLPYEVSLIFRICC